MWTTHYCGLYRRQLKAEVVFSLEHNYPDTERNGSLSTLTTYKNGLQDGVSISFSFKLIRKKSLWENGVELSVEDKE